MKKVTPGYIVVLLLVVSAVTCRKPYLPAAITAPNNYLVVDGYINATDNGVTTITLSRSRNLTDTVQNLPERNASVMIESASGNSYTLTDLNYTGAYTSNPLNLDVMNAYRLHIITADGDEFASDFVPVKIAAPIDSLTWEQKSDNNVTVYVNTHDPSKNSTYYKWDYLETWEHDSRVENYWGEEDGIIFPLDSNTQMHRCWTTEPATHIITGNSVALNEDVISRQPLTVIPQNDVRIKIRYSILASQIPITKEAYDYWSIIQKNSQQLGTLFDLQPSQLTGNIRSLKNQEEPVIGYTSAATVTEQRLFIDHDQVVNWDPTITGRECDQIIIPADPLNPFIYTYPDPEFAPFYFTGSGPLFLILIRKECIDCREQGGTNSKPAFW